MYSLFLVIIKRDMETITLKCKTLTGSNKSLNRDKCVMEEECAFFVLY